MKFLATSASDVFKTSAFVKLAAFLIVSVSLVFLLNSYYSSEYSPLTFFSNTLASLSPSTHIQVTAPSPSPPYPSPLVVDGSGKVKKKKVFRPPPLPPVERMGIVDETGAMSLDFKVGEFNSSLVEELDGSVNESVSVGKEEGKGAERIEVQKFNKCDESMTDHIPCLDNMEAIMRFNSSERGEKYERHCPEQGKGLNCLVPLPKGYRIPIPWPQSRDEVWFNNVPHTRLVEDKGGQNWIKRDNDKFIFPGGGTQFIHGADQYLNQISKMVPDIAFGYNTRVALDIGCGVASFGAFLMQRNVTTLSIAPKDVHENQIQFALERGVPAMVAVFATRRLLFPSQAFDLIHCSRCRINWTRDDGILLLEADRLLRGGGYFVWAAQPVYKNEDILHEQWKEMVDLTTRICWELVKKEGYIAIWRKPLNNSCYLNRGNDVQPLLCDSNDDPDNVWYVDLKACITRLSDSGYGTNVTNWPVRLHQPPERLQTIKIDGFISRKELFKAESKYWNEIIDSYVRAYRWKTFKMRNVMDMRAGYGGFAAALHDLELDCWIMNVVPVSGFNTLPVIYDRGLVGVMHDWCEPFDTYPRTYDLLHASGLFSVEKKRNKCNLSLIMLEMDRMLRPDGHVYIRDTTSTIRELHEIGTAMRWVCAIHDTGEGPHASWKILICEKRM